MNRHTAGRTPAPQDLVCRITSAVAAGAPNALYLVPSTASTLAAAAGWVRDAQWRVVALATNLPACAEALEALTPAQFLADCRRASPAQTPRPTVVFTDHFVSAEHAPLLVKQNDDDVFFPSLELIAEGQFGCAVAYWNGACFVQDVATPPGQASRVLALLRQYYQACEALGDDWLMRERQFQRSVAGRIATAKHRIRLYQSIVMLATTHEDSVQAQLPLLEALAALHQQLPRRAAT